MTLASYNRNYLAGAEVKVEVVHGVLEVGEDTTFDVQHPGLLWLARTDVLQFAADEGEPQRVALQGHGESAAALGARGRVTSGGEVLQADRLQPQRHLAAGENLQLGDGAHAQ